MNTRCLAALLAATVAVSVPAAAQPVADWKEANKASAEALKEGNVRAGADFALLAFRGYEAAANYSAKSHAQLLLNLLAARAQAQGETIALDEFDIEFERFRKKAGPNDPNVVQLLSEAGAITKVKPQRADEYLRRAANSAESIWGAGDARAIAQQRRWADLSSTLHGRDWAQKKLQVARDQAAKLPDGETLVWTIDLSIGRLDVEGKSPAKGAERFRSVIAQAEARKDTALRPLLVAAYSMLSYACGQGKDEACSKEAEARLNALVGGAADPLKAVARVEPEYPALAKAHHVEGAVTMRLTVGTDGAVKAANVLFANPEGYFEESVMKALKDWKFQPKTVNGKPVETTGVLSFNFSLPR